jgi:heme oxygenase (biliverdin-IX-beta and delta-forming)
LNPSHQALREATAQAHARVDSAFAGFDLTDRDSYARFLRAHADVVWPLEAALPGAQVAPDWERRKRGALLKEDLAFLGHRADPASATPDEPLRFQGNPAIAGALYVLEGSRLGGRFLARQLPPGFPRAYLDADQAAGNWRNLLDRIDVILYDAPALQSALSAAHQVFAAFERSARRWREAELGGQ